MTSSNSQTCRIALRQLLGIKQSQTTRGDEVDHEDGDGDGDGDGAGLGGGVDGDSGGEIGRASCRERVCQYV